MTSNSIATKLGEFWMSWSALDDGLTNQERRELLDPDALRRMRKNLRVAALKTGSDNVLKVIGVRGVVIGRVDNFDAHEDNGPSLVGKVFSAVDKLSST